jgi:hypothetical protein
VKKGRVERGPFYLARLNRILKKLTVGLGSICVSPVVRRMTRSNAVSGLSLHSAVGFLQHFKKSFK